MRIKVTLLLLISLLLEIKSVEAIFLDINIYNSYEVNAIDFSPISGKYILEADEKIQKEFQKGTIVNITPLRDSVLLQINHVNVGLYKEVSLYGRGFVNTFMLKNEFKKLPTRSYEDHLKVRVVDGKLQLINNVDVEHYVSGVVQSEAGGSSKNLQFFSVQAVSCRTYALVNYLKHTVDGYNLCDDVHCQYYTGKSTLPDILRSVSRTSGEVIVDSSIHMISAAFHSNCGGETVNSEDVWTLPTTYLKARTDTFCTGMSKALWNVTMPKSDFLKTLNTAFSFPVNDSLMVDSAFNFLQATRKTLFVNNIPLKLIRQEFKFRSTFFETKTEGNNVIIRGRGFGHGVGLCQQGAIHMAELGYEYPAIIQFYYKETTIIHYSELSYDFMPQF